MRREFKWRHFGDEVILWAARWYCRYGISCRELEEILAEHGILVDHTTIDRWVQRYAPEMRRDPPLVSRTWGLARFPLGLFGRDVAEGRVDALPVVVGFDVGK